MNTRLVCRICSNSDDNARFTVREMMFGSREQFEYFQCSQCGCLQIGTIPQNLGQHYPADYYSFSPGQRRNVMSYWRRVRAWYALGKRTLPGWLANVFSKPPGFVGWIMQCKGLIELGLNSPILDVGCGDGRLLVELKELGFSNLTGVDPYIEADVNPQAGLRILKCSLDQVQGKYDLIMFNHSFEHLPDQDETLSQAARLLSDDGCIMIRVPLANSYAWRTYGTSWVQLDAPRHLYLHTIQSLGQLSERIGFSIARIFYDSSEFQFWGSELYQRDIPLCDGSSRSFNRLQVREFKRQAHLLNASNDGDQACFYLQCR